MATSRQAMVFRETIVDVHLVPVFTPHSAPPTTTSAQATTVAITTRAASVPKASVPGCRAVYPVSKVIARVPLIIMGEAISHVAAISRAPMAISLTSPITHRIIPTSHTARMPTSRAISLASRVAATSPASLKANMASSRVEAISHVAATVLPMADRTRPLMAHHIIIGIRNLTTSAPVRLTTTPMQSTA